MSFGFSFSPINLVERILPGVVGVDGGDMGTENTYAIARSMRLSSRPPLPDMLGMV